MQSFLTGLQFLSRIRIVRQNDWSNERFSRSVQYFPLVGASVGASVPSSVEALVISVLEDVSSTAVFPWSVQSWQSYRIC